MHIFGSFCCNKTQKYSNDEYFHYFLHTKKNKAQRGKYENVKYFPRAFFFCFHSMQCIYFWNELHLGMPHPDSLQKIFR
jgi:hypothetical protein